MPGRPCSSTPRRLPVNHRRHKVAPENRKRVSTAQCRSGSRVCEYPAVVDKVTIPRSELDELRERCAKLEKYLDQAAYRPASGSGAVPGDKAGVINFASLPHDDTDEEESTPNEGRLLSDLDGTTRYLGSTSGATFLDLLKSFMRTIFPLAWPSVQNPEGTSFLGSLGQYQTYDSRPLVIDVEVDPFWLPMKAEMAVMMTRLRYYIQDGMGEFGSGGIYYWDVLDPSFFDSRPLESASDARSLKVLALFHAGFAMACQLKSPSDSCASTRESETYFARARRLIGNPLDTTNSTVHDIPILALMSLFLVEMNRRDAAYMFNPAVRLHDGVHHGWTPDEQGKRAFWTLYVLDRWLSCLMGRPPNILDDAIRLPLPTHVQGLPSPAGLRANVELSKISSYIVGNVYRVSPWESELVTGTYTRIETALRSLTAFYERLPAELKMPDQQFSRDRACCELHMFYYQLVILTLRPIFFMAVKKAVAERYTGRSQGTRNAQQSHASLIQQCSFAARMNLRLGRWVRNLMQAQKLMSSGLHNIFNAAIILLLRQLLFDDIEENDALDIIFAIECFDAEAVGDSNYPKDCARVLRDLSVLVQRMRNRTSDGHQEVGAPHEQPHHHHHHQQPPAATTAYDVGFILNPPEMPPNILPSQLHLLDMNDALYHELAGWMSQDDLQLYNQFFI
ncbi:fungal-specific transcription factor domain-containing protein [Xylariomycetidae sp. FL2044]|nr:fungal-specific transcription factor domain-containing protein [Xylariomycetidae sp. FL2044]